MVAALSTMYQLSTASLCLVVLAVSVPVSFMIALLCSSAVVPSSTSRESEVLAMATATYHLIADYSFCKLLFVIVPHVPEFSPVVWSSRLSVLEYVEAIYSSLCHIIYQGSHNQIGSRVTRVANVR